MGLGRVGMGRVGFFLPSPPLSPFAPDLITPLLNPRPLSQVNQQSRHLALGDGVGSTHFSPFCIVKNAQQVLA